MQDDVLYQFSDKPVPPELRDCFVILFLRKET